MSNNTDKIQLISSIITIFFAISTITSWFISTFKSKGIPRIKGYIFLISFSLWGFSSGLLLFSKFQLGTISGAIFLTLLVITIILLGKNYQLLLKSIINPYSTVIVSKIAMHNIFCETIQRVCLALVDDAAFDGNDIRVSLFSVDWKSKELLIVGRYPLISDDIPEIKYKIGRGTSGVSVESNRIIKVENLPSWDSDSEQYIRLLNKYNISGDEIRGFHTKARCYYAFPIVDRDPDEGVNIVRFVLSVDSIHPTISSENSTSENLINIIVAYINNNRQLLFKTFIGKGL